MKIDICKVNELLLSDNLGLGSYANEVHTSLCSILLEVDAGTYIGKKHYFEL